MTTFVVTSADDNWSTEEKNRFKTQPEAESRFKELASAGRYVRLVKWDQNHATVLQEANSPPSETTSQG